MRNWVFVPVAALILALVASGPATAQTENPKPSPKRSAQATSVGHVYLLRGLLNIFSLGMDDLAAKIQAKGISATVHNHAEWEALSESIAARYKAGNRGAIILVGHSLGADAVMFMGEYLGKKGVPVALIVPFDGTGSFAASSNVARVMNLTQRDYAHMRRGAGFRGELANIDVTAHGVGHIDIDKSARLHAMVVGKIQSVVGRGGRNQTAGPGGAPAPRARPDSTPDAPTPAPAATPSSAPDAAPLPAAPKPATGSTASTSAASNGRTAEPTSLARGPSRRREGAPPANTDSATSTNSALRF